MKAPDFQLTDQYRKEHKKSDYKGQWIVLYFYPKDDTPGCTKEACGFRDIANVFHEKNTVILGVSKDSVSSHKKFADKYHLLFPLLSDPEKNVIQSYGAWGKKKFMGREFEGIIRKTFLIDPEGNIQKEYLQVDPLQHAREILNDIELIQQK